MQHVQHLYPIGANAIDNSIALEDQFAGFPAPRPVSYTETRTCYGFIERLRKHNAKAGVQRIAVVAGEAQWAELNLADGILLDADQIERTMEQLRSMLAGGEVTIEASALNFDTGQDFQDYVREIRAEYRRSDVEQ